MLTISDKIQKFLDNNLSRTYTPKSLSKILHVNYETTRKYLREGFYMGSLERFWSKKDGQHRYYSVG